MTSYYDAIGLLAICDAIESVEGIPLAVFTTSSDPFSLTRKDSPDSYKHEVSSYSIKSDTADNVEGTVINSNGTKPAIPKEPNSNLDSEVRSLKHLRASSNGDQDSDENDPDTPDQQNRQDSESKSPLSIPNSLPYPYPPEPLVKSGPDGFLDTSQAQYPQHPYLTHAPAHLLSSYTYTPVPHGSAPPPPPPNFPMVYGPPHTSYLSNGPTSIIQLLPQPAGNDHSGFQSGVLHHQAALPGPDHARNGSLTGFNNVISNVTNTALSNGSAVNILGKHENLTTKSQNSSASSNTNPSHYSHSTTRHHSGSNSNSNHNSNAQYKSEDCPICGRNFKGPKASTHRQQHIRRLHPEDYIPKRGGKKRVIANANNNISGSSVLTTVEKGVYSSFAKASTNPY